MTNNSSKSNKNPDSGFNNNNMTTDTPRTDACPHCGAFLLTHHTPAYCEERTSRQKAEADVEGLRSQLKRAVEIAEGILDPFLRITGVPEHNLAALKKELK